MGTMSMPHNNVAKRICCAVKQHQQKGKTQEPNMCFQQASLWAYHFNIMGISVPQFNQCLPIASTVHVHAIIFHMSHPALSSW